MAKMRWVVPRRMLVFHEIRLIHANAFAFERFRFLRSYIQLASGGVFIVKRECAILMLLREHDIHQSAQAVLFERFEVLEYAEAPGFALHIGKRANKHYDSRRALNRIHNTWND